MQSVSPHELTTVSGGVVWAIGSSITVTASNTAVVTAPQVNVNVAGLALQGWRWPGP